MSPTLRAAILEAERLAVEFSRAAATGNLDRIGNAALDLEEATQGVFLTVETLRLPLLAEYTPPPALPMDPHAPVPSRWDAGCLA